MVGSSSRSRSGCCDEGFGDGEALLPASGERGGFGGEVGEAGDAEGRAKALLPVGFGDAGATERGFEDGADGDAGGELRILLDVGHAQVFARSDLAGVGVRFRPRAFSAAWICRFRWGR